MDFNQAEKKFKQLKAQFEAGKLTEAEFKTKLEELMVQDESGSWWMIGYETERWYRHDGKNWVQTNPTREPLQKPTPELALEPKTTESVAREQAKRETTEQAFRQQVSQPQAFLRQLMSKNRNLKAAVIVSFIVVLGIFGINYLTRQLATNDGTEIPTELNSPVNESPTSNPAMTTENLSCAECHDDTTLITGKRFAWSESLHGSGETFVRGTISSCAGCHSGGAFSERFVTGFNPDEVEFGDPNPTRQDCRACHQIHVTYSSDDWALESTDTVDLYAFEGVTYDGGEGNLCANCHQPRRDFPAPEDGMITEITSHWGPHHGPQSAMLLGIAGAGSVEGSPSAHYQAVEGTCATCHMGESANHTFEPDIAVCQSCHDGIETFDIDGVQTEVQAMIDELGDLLVAEGVLSENSSDGHPIVEEAPENVAIALWNWIYVAHEDKSLGIHNPGYTRDLLEASFEALFGQ